MASRDELKVETFVLTDADFEETSWHDNFIYGIRFDSPEFESDLSLDIDHIVKWVQWDEKRFRFWIAPATLVFHNVTDLAVRIVFGSTGHQQAISQVSIGGISRERVLEQRVCLDRPYYAWNIVTNWPDGEIIFGASGYTQTLLSQPVLCDEQQIPGGVGNKLLKGG